MAPNRDREFREVEHEDVYVGPQEFMEAGWRGFLVTTIARKEEFGVDDALDLLRQASIKIHGGYKPHGENCRRLEHQGYVKVDCLDLEKVTTHPNPNTKEEEEAKTASGPQEGDGDEEKENEDKMDDGDEEKAEDDENKDGDDEEKKEGDDEKKDGDDDKKDGEKRDRRDRRDRRRDRERRKDYKEPERMHSVYKFKAYRTEIRNRMFVLSNVPDPIELAQTAMDVVIERNKVTGDAVSQLLPVVGVCPYDFYQLEVMCKRVLASLFDEQQEPKCFDVMVIDNLSEPGSDMLAEIVRNSVWAVNPAAWLSSPVSEPDVVLRLEVLGSKLVLSALTEYMKYRQFSPIGLVDMGTGQGEDDDGGWLGEEAKRESEQYKKLKENQRALEKQRDEERQRERAKRHAEAEERAKKREEERRKERKKKEEKDKEVSEKADDMKKKAADWIATRKKELSEKEGEEEKEEEEGKKEGAAPVEKETPPTKKQKITSGGDVAEKEVEAKIETVQEEAKSTPAKSRRSTRKK